MTDQNHQTGAKAQQQGGYARAKNTATDAARRAGESIDANPLAVVAGGLAVGALAGALLPRSAKEKELLASVGKRIGDTARQAFAAAKDAGREELSGAGLTQDAARDRGKELLGGLGKALSSAGSAATQAVKTGRSGGDAAGSGSAPGTTGNGNTGGDAPGGFDARGDALTATQA